MSNWPGDEINWNQLIGTGAGDKWPGDELDWEQPIGHLPPHENIKSWHASPEREKELRALPYAEYLRTPEWHYRRRQTIQAAERKCQNCRCYHHLLNVHHRSYERLGNEDPDDLVVLCEHCHLEEHGR